MKNFKYEVRQLSWSKRRNHNTQESEVLDIELINFKKEDNHFCTMIVDYENEKIELNARVLYNDRQNYWVVAGINTKGKQCSIKLL